MSTPPKVSVCIPAFNHQKYVRATIESILTQDFQDFEIVITDDCSTDGTVDEIRAFRDERIRLFRHDRNRGPSVAANNNILNARGEYVAIVPSDDLFVPHKLSRQLGEFRRNPRLGATFARLAYIDEDGEQLERSGLGAPMPSGEGREAALRYFFFEGNCLAAPTAMIRRDIFRDIGLFDPRLLQTQDYDFWVRLCLRHEISILEEPLVRYRIRAFYGNLDANTSGKAARIYWEFTKVLENFALCTDRDLLRRVFPEMATHLDAGMSVAATVGILAASAAQRWTRRFGIEVLYRELGNPHAAEALAAAGYDFPRFFQILTAADPTGAMAAEEANAGLAVLSSEYEKLGAAHTTLAAEHGRLASGIEDMRHHVAAVEEVLGQVSAARDTLARDVEAMRDYLHQVLEARDWFRTQAERWESEYRRVVQG